MSKRFTQRFIDLANHGGCSKKAPAGELRQMFENLAFVGLGDKISDITSGFPDVGLFSLDQVSAVSTVDIVLPMVLDASDFGEITVAHVLSDIYAGLASPAFALAILGVPKGRSTGDGEIIKLMAGAIRKLGEAGVALVGGHTMADQEDLFLGFAAVGTPIASQPMSLKRSLSDGDVLVLTKPLGGSLASLRWKTDDAAISDHADVLSSMKQLNAKASVIASKFDVKGCTDVTGYGLTGHLHNLLLSSNFSAILNTARIPIFESIKNICDADVVQTRQYWHNLDYVSSHLVNGDALSELQRTCFIDSQVSGGLLIAISEASSTDYVAECEAEGISATVIGEIVSGGQIGRIIFV